MILQIDRSADEIILADVNNISHTYLERFVFTIFFPIYILASMFHREECLISGPVGGKMFSANGSSFDNFAADLGFESFTG